MIVKYYYTHTYIRNYRILLLLTTSTDFLLIVSCGLEPIHDGFEPVPIETFANDGQIDHLWVINPLKKQ